MAKRGIRVSLTNPYPVFNVAPAKELSRAIGTVKYTPKTSHREVYGPWHQIQLR